MLESKLRQYVIHDKSVAARVEYITVMNVYDLKTVFLFSQVLKNGKCISYHMSSFKDPVEGKVFVCLVESTSLVLCLWILQCCPFHLVEVLEPIPFQLFHPQLLTYTHTQQIQINYHKSAETLFRQHAIIIIFLHIKWMGKMNISIATKAQFIITFIHLIGQAHIVLLFG